MQVDTLDADIRAAMSKVSGGDDGGQADGAGAAGGDSVDADAGAEAGSPGESEPVRASPDVPSSAQRTRDAAGRFAPKAQAAKETGTEAPIAGKPASTEAPKAAVPSATAPPTPGASDQTKAELKAPQNWRPAAREKFASLPPEVQQEAVRVHHEAQKAMQESANSRRWHGEFTQALSPYVGLLHSHGYATPMEAVAGMAQTYARIFTAPMSTRAETMAKLIKDSGVDIEHLASALNGQPAPQGQGQQHQAQFLPEDIVRQTEERILGRIQAQRDAALRAKIDAELEQQLPGMKFMDDVREDVADILELAARRGRAMTLKQAYDVACKQHPEIAPILEQQAQSEAAKAQIASTQRSRAAAVSVRSQPSSAPEAPAKDDLDSTLRAAYRAAKSG